MLRKQIASLTRRSGAVALAAACYDYETETAWSYQGSRWFHAASTIKAALLVAVFDAVAQGRYTLENRVHVRNRFLSAHNGEPFRVSGGRDGNSSVHAAIGKSIKVKYLAHHMITTSSNLATNLLLEMVGIEAAQETLSRLRMEGIEIVRGVEDEEAHAAGINNRVTAIGLLNLFQCLHERRGIAEEHARAMIDILAQQEFRNGIPAGLPEDVRRSARIAHKTGEISTVCHDAGLIYLPERKPYGLVVLTEWNADDAGSSRRETVAEVSRMLYEALTEPEKAEDA